MKIRQLSARDRPLLALLLSKITSFDEADRALALELIDFSIADPKQENYLFHVVVNGDDQPIGYACFGPTPLTDGTYDLFWIAVDPTYAGQGVGSRLMRAVEQEVQKRRGRLLIIETSSSEDYEQTREFYLQRGCIQAETIKDFYRPGEDRVLFVKRV